MEVELYQKLLKSLTDPAAIVLFVWLLSLIREDYRKGTVIEKLLKVQLDEATILTKIVVMVEALFTGIRRA